MFQQILKLSNVTVGKKDSRSSQSAEIKRKKRKQSTDSNIFLGTEESSSKSKRMKVQVKKYTGKSRHKKGVKASDWPNLEEFQVTHHASPKIWDMFERFQNFAQRRVLKRHPSGLLESSVDETTEENLQSDNKSYSGKRSSSGRNYSQSSEPFPVTDENESSMGGDRKRRCVEICDYEDDVSCAGQRTPQPASAFKPKCLNFDNVDES